MVKSLATSTQVFSITGLWNPAACWREAQAALWKGTEAPLKIVATLLDGTKYQFSELTWKLNCQPQSSYLNKSCMKQKWGISTKSCPNHKFMSKWIIGITFFPFNLLIWWASLVDFLILNSYVLGIYPFLSCCTPTIWTLYWASSLLVGEKWIYQTS